MVLCVPPVKECYLSKIISYVHFPASCSDALYVFGITFRFLDSVLPISMNGKLNCSTPHAFIRQKNLNKTVVELSFQETGSCRTDFLIFRVKSGSILLDLVKESLKIGSPAMTQSAVAGPHMVYYLVDKPGLRI